MYKTVFVKANLKVAGKGYTDCQVDGARLSKDIEGAINTLSADGYQIVSVTPIISGMYNWSSGMTTYSYGFSYTDGIIITATKS